MLREAITNVIRHSRARRCVVRLSEQQGSIEALAEADLVERGNVQLDSATFLVAGHDGQVDGLGEPLLARRCASATDSIALAMTAPFVSGVSDPGL
jgi:hypothetical protein